jgi:capsule polysaccharide export protein KpsE/RkpR
MAQLRDDIEAAKTEYENDVLAQNMEVANLKDSLLEARRASKGQEIYTGQLETVREHESTRSMIKRENALVTEMNRLRTEIAHEQRVNMEIESWLRDRHTFLKHLHAHWTRKLRDDVAAKEAELQKLKRERESDRQAYEDAKKSYEEAKIFIDEATEKMRRIEAIKQRQELEKSSATRIQAWWKMIMVTKCLGPYKKKKKAQAKDEKGTGGKKKK